MQREIELILIHGTFAHDAHWVERPSDFISALDDALKGSPPVHFEAFKWNGKNSHQARQQAAMDLSVFLEKQRLQSPNRDRYIIAHSHGGNIAMMAINSQELTNTVAGIITLGTPFISSKPRVMKNVIKMLQRYVPPFIFFGGFVSCFLLMILLPDRWSPWIDAHTNSVVIDASLLGAALLGRSALKRLPDWATRCQEITSARFKHLPNLPALFCVTALDDEAARWLALLRTITNLPSSTLSLFSRFWYSLVGVSCLGTLAVALIEPHPQSSVIANILAVVAFVTMVMVVPFQLIVIVFPTVIRSHRLGFGGESITDNWFSDIYTTAVPIGIQCATYNAVPGTAPGLNHSSFFSDSAVPEAIGRWIMSSATLNPHVPV